jgi:hypothetical protein
MRDRTPGDCTGLYAARNAQAKAGKWVLAGKMNQPRCAAPHRRVRLQHIQLSRTGPTNLARSPRRDQASGGSYAL